jgi:hypothetical protein
MKIDLFKMVPEIKIPVFFMEGRFDHERPSDIAARYFDWFKAPSKRSRPTSNQKKGILFNKVIVEKILPIAVTHDVSQQNLAYNKLLEYDV